MVYDPDNVFAKILRGEIPNKTVFENNHALAFHDVNPQAPTHVLVIPKGSYIDFDDFTANASPAEISGFFAAAAETARKLGLGSSADGRGYRILTNCGPDGGQEVPHFHVHIFGGRKLGPMLPRRAT